MQSILNMGMSDGEIAKSSLLSNHSRVSGEVRGQSAAKPPVS
jgi:hypothetical protein